MTAFWLAILIGNILALVGSAIALIISARACKIGRDAEKISEQANRLAARTIERIEGLSRPSPDGHIPTIQDYPGESLFQPGYRPDGSYWYGLDSPLQECPKGNYLYSPTCRNTPEPKGKRATPPPTPPRPDHPWSEKDREFFRQEALANADNPDYFPPQLPSMGRNWLAEEYRKNPW